MKEFEKDNWEISAQQLADAFQPKPDESVWLNVEAELKQKKRRRFFFWLFSVVGVAGLVYGGVNLNLFGSMVENKSLMSVIEKPVPVKSEMSTVAVTDTKNEINILSENKTAVLREGNNTVTVAIKGKPNTKNQVINTIINEEVTSLNLTTVIKENVLNEKSDLILTETAIEIIKPINPIAFCGFKFQEPKLLLPSDLILGNQYFKKHSRWMLLASTSIISHHSVLQSTDSIKTFQKPDVNYYDGSLNLIYQFPKAKNIELDFGIGFYEMSQNYTESKYLVFTSYDTTTGAPLASFDKLSDTENGSEFFRNSYFDFGIGLPIISGKKISWIVSAGIRTEYILRYLTHPGSGGMSFVNQFSGLNSNAVFESISENPLNRIYLKGMLNTSLRYSLSQKLGLQAGINSNYSLTDRYKKSGSLHQHDLNYGINAGVFYRF